MRRDITNHQFKFAVWAHLDNLVKIRNGEDIFRILSRKDLNFLINIGVLIPSGSDRGRGLMLSSRALGVIARRLYRLKEIEELI